MCVSVCCVCADWPACAHETFIHDRHRRRTAEGGRWSMCWKISPFKHRCHLSFLALDRAEMCLAGCVLSTRAWSHFRLLPNTCACREAFFLFLPSIRLISLPPLVTSFHCFSSSRTPCTLFSLLPSWHESSLLLRTPLLLVRVPSKNKVSVDAYQRSLVIFPGTVLCVKQHIFEFLVCISCCVM